MTATSGSSPTASTATRSGRSPFDHLKGTALLAGGYGLASGVWIVFGDLLPGGRWLAVHLFTLGMLTNLVLAMSAHFGRTLLRQPGDEDRLQIPLANLGAILLLLGLPEGWTWAVATGATLLAAVVFRGYWLLRRMRKRAVGARFVFVVRLYERAHSQFLHGATLGALIGTGVLTGRWYLPARTAHLHVMVLGWGVLTLLATVVFFGPTILRVQMLREAQQEAAVWLRHGASALSVAVLALLGTGFGGWPGTALRWVAAAGLAVFAWAAVVVARAVVRVAPKTTFPALSGYLITAASAWLLVSLWLDVAVVAVGRWRLLDAVGVLVLVGSLAQAIVAALTYMVPLMRGRSGTEREGLRLRVEVARRSRAFLLNAGIVCVAVAAVLGPGAGTTGAVLARVGWGVVLAILVSAAVLAVGARRREVPLRGDLATPGEPTGR